METTAKEISTEIKTKVDQLTQLVKETQCCKENCEWLEEFQDAENNEKEELKKKITEITTQEDPLIKVLTNEYQRLQETNTKGWWYSISKIAETLDITAWETNPHFYGCHLSGNYNTTNRTIHYPYSYKYGPQAGPLQFLKAFAKILRKRQEEEIKEKLNPTTYNFNF